MAPDSSSQLSDGVVIEASVLARLLGFRLLTLEGTVLVSPAQLTDHDPPAVGAPRASADPVAVSAHPIIPSREAPDRTAGRAPDAVGHRLGVAAALLQQSADEMAQLGDIHPD